MAQWLHADKQGQLHPHPAHAPPPFHPPCPYLFLLVITLLLLFPILLLIFFSSFFQFQEFYLKAHLNKMTPAAALDFGVRRLFMQLCQFTNLNIYICIMN